MLKKAPQKGSKFIGRLSMEISLPRRYLNCHFALTVDEKQTKINRNNYKIEYIYCKHIIDVAGNYLTRYACYIANKYS